MMTKKVYEAVVKILNKNLANDNEREQKIKEEMTKDFVWIFKNDNPKFDENKFRDALK